MTDPFSISVGILTFLGTAKKVIGYIDDLKDATVERLKIRNEISSAEVLLGALKDRIDQVQTGSVELPNLRSLATTKGPLVQFTSILDDLSIKLAPAVGFRAIRQALGWPLGKSEMREKLTTLERVKSCFELALQNDVV